jgi:PhnB protein
MQVQPYLQFDGRCEEAIEFYKSALGAEVEALMRFKDAPDPAMAPPNSGNKILHSCFQIGGTRVMASDGYCKGNPEFQGFSLTITTQDKDETDRLFKALEKGGDVRMPLAESFFSPRFGMVADRFGVSWMIVTRPQDADKAAA